MKLSLRFKYLITFALLICIVEFYVLASNISYANKLLFHLSLSVVCLISVISLSPFKEKEDLRFPILFAVLLTFMGPIGAILGIVTIFLYLFYSINAPNIQDLLASIFPEHNISRSYYHYDRIIHGLDEFDSESKTTSFIDIMSFGASAQKRLALEKITRYFNPQFSKALFVGLNDEDNQIRVLAATSITTLDQIYFKKYLELEKEYQENKDNKKTILHFALHCDRYYASKILDKERGKKVIAKAIEAYEKYFSLDPGHDGAMSQLLKLYILSNQPQKAISFFESYQTRDNIPIKAKIFYLNALYDLSRFSKLRKFIASESNLVQVLENKELITIAHLWSASV